jgi:hypothetical protein
MLIKIVPLKDRFGLLEEYGDTNSLISLISLDLSRYSLQKLHTVEYPTFDIPVIINKADTTTFMLNLEIDNRRSSQICEIVDNTIIIGDVI